jgi:hypothetical protein
MTEISAGVRVSGDAAPSRKGIHESENVTAGIRHFKTLAIRAARRGIAKTDLRRQ